MQLNGLQRSTSKPRGGVQTVELIAASWFEGAVWDDTSRCFTSMQTSAPLSCYVFREDGATYTEQSSGMRQKLVKHTLSMEFAVTSEASLALSELASVAKGGVVAIVTTGAGEKLLVGYSRKFGGRFPLRLESHTCASGTAPADFPVHTIVLACEDTEPSWRLSAV
ncbi:MAG: hypothetical protein LBM63_03000 [Rikenellaceae bacterium]|jgi:hypothetical protein|nr:hypothetical protein [Rikenellaceae bacterium]